MEVVQPEPSTPQAAQPSNATLERLTKALELSYIKPGALLWRSFLHGLFVSLGATVGAALVFLVVGWVLLQVNWGPVSENIWNSLIPADIREQLTGTPQAGSRASSLEDQVNREIERRVQDALNAQSQQTVNR